MSVAVEEPKNSDAAAVALLKWILAGLILLNGIALVVSANSQSAHGGLLGGYRSDYAAGLACALVGGLCWMLSRAAISGEDREQEWSAVRPDQRSARDRAIVFGALAIMLWVASLTTFVTGCEHVSWSPIEDHKLKPLQAPGRADRHQTAFAQPSDAANPGGIMPQRPASA